MVGSWYSGSNYGLEVRYTNESLNDYNYIYSSDNAETWLRPYFLVSYTYADDYIEPGDYFIKSVCSGKYLDVAGAGSASGTQVWQYGFNATDAQRWTITSAGVNDAYTLTPACAPGMSLDWGPGNIAQIYTAVNSLWEQWCFQQNPNGSYTIVSVADLGMALDVEGWSLLDCGNVMLYPVHGDTNQQWILEPVTSLPVNTEKGAYLVPNAAHWYIFTPSVTGSYTFTATGSTDTYGELYQDLTLIASDDDDGAGYNFLITKQLTAGVQYLLKVRGYSPSTPGGYILTAKYKKAYVMVPGIMGSEMYTRDSNVPSGPSSYFSNNTKIWDPTDGQVIASASYIPLALKCSTSGSPVYATGPKFESSLLVTPKGSTINNPQNISTQYGALDIFRNLYQALYNEPTIHNNGDIVLYEYDWRKDPYDTANDLYNFLVNIKGYTDITLIGYSMGGLVSSHLVRNLYDNGQMDLITKYISVNVPYLGSPLAPRIYRDGKFLNGGGLLNMIGNHAMCLGITMIAPNIKTLYALTPPSQYFEPYLIPDGSSVPYSTYANTMSWLAGNLDNWNSTLYTSIKNNQSRLFIGGTHITQFLSDAYYIIGTGESTTQTIKVHFPLLSYIWEFVEQKTNAGDDTVPMSSATIGWTISGGSKTFFKVPQSGQTGSHMGMIQGKDNDFTTINFIVGIVKGTITASTGSSTLSTYGMTKTTPQLSPGGWIPGVNDQRIELSFALGENVTVRAMDGNILYSPGIQASCVFAQPIDGNMVLSIEKTEAIQIETSSTSMITVKYLQAGELMSETTLAKSFSESTGTFDVSIASDQMTVQRSATK